VPPASRPAPDFYELFANGTFDLGSRAFELLPLGFDGYFVNPISSAAFFGGFTNAAAHGDDTTVQHVLPFGFPFPNGFANAVGQCSNGFLWLEQPLSNAPFFPNVVELLQDRPRIAALWTDLDPSAGGTIYFDVVNPGLVAFTWSNVLEFGGTGIATFQIQLESTGRIVVAYQTVAITSHPVMVAFSRGYGVNDPGPSDLSAEMPFAAGSRQVAMELALESGNPRTGSSFGLRIDQQPVNATLALLVLGLQQRNTQLGGIGMPGCKQYASADTILFQSAGAPTVFTLSVPAGTLFLGFTLFSQAAVLSPGFNALGVSASNGGRITIGFL
jgi:hypothetical protein